MKTITDRPGIEPRTISTLSLCLQGYKIVQTEQQTSLCHAINNGNY